MPDKGEQTLTPSTDQVPAADLELPSPCKDRRLTIPNLICVARLIGSLGLIGVAVAGHAHVFVIGFIVLSLSDWVDGRLARWLNQRSDFGASLDSAADAVLYGCLLIGSLILKWDVLMREMVWLLVPLARCAISTGYGLWKYGRVPSYHTYGAKTCQWLVLIGAVSLLLEWSLWPIRIAAVAGTLTNLETTAITYILPAWRADVLTVRDVLPGRQQTSDNGAGADT